jgi:O-antigen ligase
LITTRFHQDTRLEKMSIEQRVTSYHQAQSIIKSHFLTGVGLNNYTVVLQKNEPNQSAWYYQPVHDVGLLTWAELGIIGLLLFIMIIISAFRHRSQYWLALLVILLLGCFDHYFRSMYFGIMLWWLIIGVSLNLSIKNNAHYQ